MGLLDWAMAFFRKVAPEALTHLESASAAADHAAALLEQKDRADCYELELLRSGYSRATLQRKVDAYRRDILQEVRRAS